MKKSFLIILFFASLGTNVFFLYKYLNLKHSFKPAPSTTSFRLINPSLETFIDSNIQTSELILHYRDLKPQIEAEIPKDSKNVGLFLQDVKTGAWLGINEQEGFVPASLLKVPLMMAMLKKVERNEIQLTDTVELAAEDLNSGAGNLYQKGIGAKLTVWELLKIMVLTSDNTAKNAIKRQLLAAEIDAVFTHVGIPNPYESENGQTVSPRSYSRIFKSLYLSTFLKPELSEKALDLTTDTQVESLISAGVPPEIQVAHKYGERPDELSDCGIIYHSQSPYYLCVMVKNLEIPQTKQLIVNLSKIIYDFVAKKNY